MCFLQAILQTYLLKQGCNISCVEEVSFTWFSTTPPTSLPSAQSQPHTAPSSSGREKSFPFSSCGRAGAAVLFQLSCASFLQCCSGCLIAVTSPQRKNVAVGIRVGGRNRIIMHLIANVKAFTVVIQGVCHSPDALEASVEGLRQPATAACIHCQSSRSHRAAKTLPVLFSCLSASLSPLSLR